MGRIWLIVTSGCDALARTRLPSRSSRLPVRPVIGARIVAYCRLSRASSTAARLPARLASGGSRSGPDLLVLLGGHVLLLGQRLVAARLLRRVCRLGTVSDQCSDRLVQRGAIGPRVQLEKHLPALNLVALGKGDSPQRAFDLGLDGYGLKRLDLAGGSQLERNRATFGGGHRDRHRRRRGWIAIGAGCQQQHSDSSATGEGKGTWSSAAHSDPIHP